VLLLKQVRTRVAGRHREQIVNHQCTLIAATLSALVSRPSTTHHLFTFGGGPVLNLENMAGVVRVSHSRLILAGNTTLIVTARSCESLN